MSQTNINIRVDEDIKKQAEDLFAGLGFNISTAVNIFLRQSLSKRGLPFDVKEDPFCNPANMKVLQQSIQDANKGKLTAHELIEE